MSVFSILIPVHLTRTHIHYERWRDEIFPPIIYRFNIATSPMNVDDRELFWMAFIRILTCNYARILVAIHAQEKITWHRCTLNPFCSMKYNDTKQVPLVPRDKCDDPCSSISYTLYICNSTHIWVRFNTCLEFFDAIIANWFFDLSIATIGIRWMQLVPNSILFFINEKI